EFHLPISMKLFLELLPDQSVSAAGALHYRAARGGFIAHEQRDSDQAFVAYHGNFRRTTVFQHVQQRYDGVSRKIDVAQDIAGFVQDLAKRHLNELQVRVESLLLRG